MCFLKDVCFTQLLSALYAAVIMAEAQPSCEVYVKGLSLQQQQQLVSGQARGIIKMVQTKAHIYPVSPISGLLIGEVRQQVLCQTMTGDLCFFLYSNSEKNQTLQQQFRAAAGGYIPKTLSVIFSTP